MKSRFNRIIATILVIASLVSAFSIFVSAEDTESGAPTGPDTSGITLILNRDFDEGWDYNNGFTISNQSNNVHIDHEIQSDNEYNYFLRVEAASSSETLLYYPYSAMYSQTTNGTVLKASFKADDLSNMSGQENTIASILSAETNQREYLSILGIKDGHLYAYADKTGSTLIDLGELKNDWIDLAIVFDWDKGDFFYTIYYGEDYSEKKAVTYAYNKTGDGGFRSVRFGIPKAADAAAGEVRMGMSYCIDNFALYNNSKEVFSKEVIDSIGYGNLVDATWEKTIEILSGSAKTKEQILEDALCMKLGVDYALFRDVRQPIFTKEIKGEDGTVLGTSVFGAPEKVDGTVMVPLQLILDYIGFPSYVHQDGMSYDITTGTGKTNLVAGRDSASVNGERVQLATAPGFVSSGESKYLVIALEDVETLFPGWLSCYDEMGLIVIYQDLTPDNSSDNSDIVTRDADLDLMVDLMKQFIYTTYTKGDNGETLNATDSYVKEGTAVYNDVKKFTNNFKHPYIGVTQDSFDKLNKVYNATAGTEHYNVTAKNYLTKLISDTEAFFSSVAKLDGNGKYESIIEGMEPVNVYNDGKNPDEQNGNIVADTPDGYSPDGRLPELVAYADKLLDLAFAYQVTRDTKYAKLAYDWAIELGNWGHWAPGFMSDCAAATYSFSVSYDWLYNIYLELYGEEGIEALAKIIFENGVHDGYVSSSGKDCEHPRNLGDSSAYSSLGSHVNAVGASGMIAGALALMEFDTIGDDESFKDEAIYVVGNNIINLINNGLELYAPDGSYAESVPYWAEGTNALFRLIMSLTTAAGTDYGFVDTWGINTSCYYAVHIESSDGKIWNYNEAGPDGVTTGAIPSADTSMFNYAAQLFGDSVLASVRHDQLTSLTNPKEVTMYDMLFYPFDGIVKHEEFALDYHIDGLDAFVSRSGWEAGSMYTGLMGGANNVSYGQLDSGNFIYHNKGVVWFMDLGSDNPSAYQYLGSARNNYYRVNPEGQNVVVLTSDSDGVKFGQYSTAGGKIVKTFVNEHGSYAILDNSSVYRDNVLTATRGIFVTNDRNTVVIQDEINFGAVVQSVAWVAHSAQDIKLSEDKKTAFLTGKNEAGETYTLRVSLVSQSRSHVFSVKTADELILADVTYGPDQSVNLGGAKEYSRSGIKRLVIEAKDTINFNCSVAIELVPNKDSTVPVGYSWTAISNWEPYAMSDGSDDDKEQIRVGAKEDNIRVMTELAMKYFEDGVAFSDNLAEFYEALTVVYYTMDYFENDVSSSYMEIYEDYLDLVDIYGEFKGQVEIIVDSAFFFADSMAGVTEGGDVESGETEGGETEGGEAEGGETEGGETEGGDVEGGESEE